MKDTYIIYEWEYSRELSESYEWSKEKIWVNYREEINWHLWGHIRIKNNWKRWLQQIFHISGIWIKNLRDTLNDILEKQDQ